MIRIYEYHININKFIEHYAIRPLNYLISRDHFAYNYLVKLSN